jgi:hypothetical protein
MTSGSSFIDVIQVSSEKVQQFSRYWRNKMRQRSAAVARFHRPGRNSTPAATSGYRRNCAGAHTRVVEANGSNYTDCYLDECDFLVEPLLVECYRRLTATRAPVFAYYEWNRRNWRGAPGSIGASESGFFPLSSDGTAIDLAISIADSDVRPYPPDSL